MTSLPESFPSKNLIKQKIADRFGAAVTNYHGQAEIQKQCADYLLNLIGKKQARIPFQTILELGCGTGFLTQGLIEQFPQSSLEITDLSPEMVGFCQAHLHISEAQRSLIRFRSLDGECLENTTNLYNLIVSNFVIQWFQDPSKSLQALLDRLHPGGILAFSFPSSSSFPEWRKICEDLNFPLTVNPLPNFFDLLNSLMGKASDCQFYAEWMSSHYENAYDFFRYLKAIGADSSLSEQYVLPSQLRTLIRFWNETAPNPIEVSYHVVFVILQR
jgi:malonyl-CoA O-methyltransferase